MPAAATPSSLRKQGPIRRGGCFERRWPPAFPYQQGPVVMGPCFRRDDGENVLATAGTRVIAIFSILERRCRPRPHRRPGERRDPYVDGPLVARVCSCE